MRNILLFLTLLLKPRLKPGGSRDSRMCRTVRKEVKGEQKVMFILTQFLNFRPVLTGG